MINELLTKTAASADEMRGLKRAYEAVRGSERATVMLLCAPHSAALEVRELWARSIREGLEPGGLALVFGIRSQEEKKALLALFAPRWFKEEWVFPDGPHGLGGIGMAFALSEPERFADETIVGKDWWDASPKYPLEFINSTVIHLAGSDDHVTNLINTEGHFARVHCGVIAREYRAFVPEALLARGSKLDPDFLHTRRAHGAPAPVFADKEGDDLDDYLDMMKAVKKYDLADLMLIRAPRHFVSWAPHADFQEIVREGLSHAGVACTFGFASVADREEFLRRTLPEHQIKDEWFFSGSAHGLAGYGCAFTIGQTPAGGFFAARYGDYDRDDPHSLIARIIHDCVRSSSSRRIMNLLSSGTDVARIDLNMDWDYCDSVYEFTGVTPLQERFLYSASRGYVARRRAVDEHFDERILLF